jgi:hypothetical protein
MRPLCPLWYKLARTNLVDPFASIGVIRGTCSLVPAWRFFLAPFDRLSDITVGVPSIGDGEGWRWNACFAFLSEVFRHESIP